MSGLMEDLLLPRLSLCICTFRRPEDLRRCLASVADGTEVPYEVIVSDDAGDPEIETLTSAYQWVRYQVGPGEGLAANRNACLKSATGDVVAFIDDDVIVPRQFVARARRTGAGPEIVTGCEINYGSVARLVTPHNADYLGYQRVSPDGKLESIVINATVFPRELFDEINFDDHLRYGSDEVDIARHSVAKGRTIRFDGELYVRHYPAPTNREGNVVLSNASRIYATTKLHARYRRHPTAAVAYFVVASVHLLIWGVRNGRREVVQSVSAIRRAARCSLSMP